MLWHQFAFVKLLSVFSRPRSLSPKKSRFWRHLAGDSSITGLADSDHLKAPRVKHKMTPVEPLCQSVQETGHFLILLMQLM